MARREAELDPPPSIVWAPQPGPQTLAMTCPFNEIFYGGARGGGKTDFLLGKAAQHCALYGQAATVYLFRQSFPELEQVIQRSKEIYGPIGGRWWDSKKTWHLPGGGMVKLRYLKRPDDAARYQGHQATMVMVDEAGNWPSPAPVDMLRGILRSAQGVPCQLILTANPGGAGHAWLKRRYIDGRTPLTPYLDQTTTFTSVFIPAKLKDNPALALKDPTYEARLRASGPAWLVRAWLEGDWNATPDVEGALWTSAILDACRVDKAPQLQSIVIGVDPAVTGGPDSDETGIIVVGLGEAELGGEAHAYVLADFSLRGRPAAWAAAVVRAFNAYGANVVVAEVNQGGDLVEDALRAVEAHLPLKTVRAAQGKRTRAEPVAALYEAGPGRECRVHHVGRLDALEAQMTTWLPGVLKSPDRLDALVWAITYLLVKNQLTVWEA